eukprot:4824823-Pleurochrysis_carterae.AAC.1
MRLSPRMQLLPNASLPSSGPLNAHALSSTRSRAACLCRCSPGRAHRSFCAPPPLDQAAAQPHIHSDGQERAQDERRVQENQRSLLPTEHAAAKQAHARARARTRCARASGRDAASRASASARAARAAAAAVPTRWGVTRRVITITIARWRARLFRRFQRNGQPRAYRGEEDIAPPTVAHHARSDGPVEIETECACLVCAAAREQGVRQKIS